MVLESAGPETTKTIKINGLTLKDSRVKTLAMRMDARKGQMTATAVSPEGSGKQYILDQNGKVEEKEIPIQLESPTPMAKFKSTDDSQIIDFIWKMPKQKEVWLEVAKDREFTKIQKRISTAQLSSKVALPAGSYFHELFPDETTCADCSRRVQWDFHMMLEPQLQPRLVIPKGNFSSITHLYPRYFNHRPGLKTRC
jgi:hypothetical protein